MDCLFCKFASGEVAKDFVFENDFVMVFDDIHPLKPVHVLIVPKKHIAAFEHLDDDVVLQEVRKAIQLMAKEKGLIGKGYRITINGGGAQAINHLHFHLTGPWGLNAAM